MTLHETRKDDGRRTLSEAEAGDDPLALFGRWFAEAAALADSASDAPRFTTLATVDEAGRPDARMVLLKGFDEQGFTFFTNYHSRKARQLAVCPHAALVLHWPALERQVRVRGAVVRTTREESAAYFQARPRGSQIGAWASDQSDVIAGRAALEQQAAAVEQRFANRDVPTPEHWGGYRLTPEQIEFWQCRSDRLHDRLLYTRAAAGAWRRVRLGP